MRPESCRMTAHYSVGSGEVFATTCEDDDGGLEAGKRWVIGRERWRAGLEEK